MGNHPHFRAGKVALVGRPNVGKSTLLNALLGQKVAITTSRPQTTRNRILGVKNLPEGQLALVDTPGLHKPHGRGRSKLNVYMVEAALSALDEVDLVAVIVEPPPVEPARLQRGRVAPQKLIDEGTRYVFEEVKRSGKPCVLVVNKVDYYKDKKLLLPLLAQYAAIKEPAFLDVVPISARKNDNVERLAKVLVSHLPEGEALFPEEMLTDRAERFLAAEFIREQVFLATRQEVPHSVAVSIDSFTERPEKNDVVIEATIHVEKLAQKKIVVGDGGQQIRDIGTKARAEIGKLLDCPVHLSLFVRVDEDWTEDPGMLVELGYDGRQ